MKKLFLNALLMVLFSSAFSQTVNDQPIKEYLAGKNYIRVTVMEDNQKSYATIQNGKCDVDASKTEIKKEGKTMFFKSSIDVVNYLNELGFNLFYYTETYNKYGFRTVIIMNSAPME